MTEQAEAVAARAETTTVAIGPAAPTPHGEAWGALTRTHAAVTQRLQDALAQAEFPPLPWYEMLATLAESPEQRMRMGDLAEALVITRGGLTKLVDRLIKAGLLERTFCETDRRVSYATLMPAGAELLAEMRPVVVAELQVAFSANLTARQADELTHTLERVRGSACGAA
ncbi:MAG TPA: MarR family transcriptional regulator [Solirubrobacterales bacterium]|jgi:DNA-binding MarR family transcriptional regulator|nr:MarR family transcriptional regulator [Solirubrobacterales bacterium]